MIDVTSFTITRIY